MSMHKIAFVLLIIGGLNWLLVGTVGWDVSRFLGGETSMISRAVYILVGLAAVYEMVSHRECCKACENKVPTV